VSKRKPRNAEETALYERDVKGRTFAEVAKKMEKFGFRTPTGRKFNPESVRVFYWKAKGFLRESDRKRRDASKGATGTGWGRESPKLRSVIRYRLTGYMYKLWREGLSYTEIARRLNQEGYRTEKGNFVVAQLVRARVKGRSRKLSKPRWKRQYARKGYGLHVKI
jgi:hypothetical protein